MIKIFSVITVTAMFLAVFSCGEGAALNSTDNQATNGNHLNSTVNLEFFVAIKGTEIGGFLNNLMVESADDNALTDDLLEDNESDYEEDIDDIDALLDDYEEKHELQLSEFGKMFQVNIDSDNRYFESPQLGFAKSIDTARINEIIRDNAEEVKFENVRFVWSAKEIEFTDTDTLYYALYALQIPADGNARVNSSDINIARVSIDPDDGSIGVAVSMNATGAEEWGDMTAENIGNFIAITLDRKVLSAPIIHGAIRGGETLISGGFSNEEAEKLTKLLNANGV